MLGPAIFPRGCRCLLKRVSFCNIAACRASSSAEEQDRADVNLKRLADTMFNGPSSFPSFSSHFTAPRDEQAVFRKMSSSWWDEEGGMKALHAFNKLRTPFVRDGLINAGLVDKDLVDSPVPLKDLEILEVGCGGGILAEALARLGAAMTGIDVTPELITEAKRHAQVDPSLTNLKYSLESVEEHVKTNPEKYHAVVASEVLEHVAEKDAFLEACVQSLRPGGLIFITTLNKTTWSWLGGIIFAENILRLVPQGTHNWEKFIAPHQVQRILEDNLCRTRIIHGMCYNFLTNSWSWVQDTSINYALQAKKNAAE